MPARRAPRATGPGYAVPLAALLLTLSSCGGGDARDGAGPGPAPATSSSPGTTTSSPTRTPAPTPSPDRTGSAAVPPGGTAGKPAALTARDRPLDWRPVPGPVAATVTRSGPWTLTVDEAGTQARLEGPDSGQGIGAGPRQRISDALLDGKYAVVVLQDRQEARPSSAEVVDLGSGDTFTIDGSSDVPTTNGGTWALGGGRLLHATVHRGSYCVASVDLASRHSELGWCAPRRHGFNGARITPSGGSLLTFDASRPACRTVVALDGAGVTPFRGVADCQGWDGLVIPDGAVWSVVPNEHRVEAAHAYARVGDAYYDLGPAVSGSLTWCAGAAYFVRDPQRDRDPAQLLRWSPGRGLESVYATAGGGHAFLEAPRCAGDTVTVTSRAQSGDEQVSATIG